MGDMSNMVQQLSPAAGGLRGVRGGGYDILDMIRKSYLRFSCSTYIILELEL